MDNGENLNWKTLKNYSRYLVSDCGKIYDKSLSKIINQQVTGDGYKCVTLRDDFDKRKTFRIHRLVAICFIDNPLDKETVNHKDGNKINNKLYNLEWNTRSENIQHAWENGLISDLGKRKAGIREKQGKPVLCVNTGEVFNSSGLAAEVKGLKKSNISAVCRKKRGFNTAGKDEFGNGLIWRFLEDE